MQEFKDAELSTLIDLLAYHTSRYSKLLSMGHRGEEFEESRTAIEIIQEEIRTRQKNGSHNTNADTAAN
jgi:hypothetical protein